MGKTDAPEGQDSQDLRLLKNAAAFNEAYGLFMLLFSQAEAQTYDVLVRYAGVTDMVARSIFSGTRMKAMTGFIAAILENTSASDATQEHLKFVFDQISVINGMRDKLVHFGVPIYTFDGPIVSNRKRVSRPANAKNFGVSVVDLGNMHSDLQAINLHLSLHLGNNAFSGLPDMEGWPTTWRYKSSQPTGNSRATTPSPQRRKAQR